MASLEYTPATEELIYTFAGNRGVLKVEQVGLEDGHLRARLQKRDADGYLVKEHFALLDGRAGSKLACDELNLAPDFLAMIARELRAKYEGQGVGNDLPLPFPIGVLPGRFRAMVEAVGTSLDVDPSFAALPLFAAAGALIGGNVALQLKPGWTEPAIVWTVVIAPSSAGKTPAADAILAPIAMAERRALAEHQQRRATYEAELADWQALPRGERTKIARPGEPALARIITDDPTLEALAVLLRSSPGVLYEAGEITAWLAGFDRYRSGKGGDRGRWLKLWGHHLWTLDRKTSQGLYVSRPHIALTGGIQPRRLGSFAKDLESGDGLFPRLLYAFPPMRIPSPSELGIEGDVAEAYAKELLRLRKELPQPKPGEPDNADQHIVVLAPAASTVWNEWLNDLAARRRAPALLDSALGEYLGKLPAHCARLSLVLHALTYPGDYHRRPISEETLADAIQLGEYFAAHAQRVLRHIDRDDSPSLGSVELPRLSEQRRKIVEVLAATDQALSPQQIVEQSGFNSSQVRSLLHDMVRDGQVLNESRGKYRSNIANIGNNEPFGASQQGKSPQSLRQQASNNAAPMLPTGDDVANSVTGQQQPFSSSESPKAGNVADVADASQDCTDEVPATADEAEGEWEL